MCAQLSLEERRARGTEAATGTPLSSHRGWRPAAGWTLARSGDPAAMAAYLGEGEDFDRSVTDFASRYADQNERDYEEFLAAIRSGRLTAVEGV
jgi:hypothetical protein